MVQESCLLNSNPKIHVMDDSDIVKWTVHTHKEYLILLNPHFETTVSASCLLKTGKFFWKFSDFLMLESLLLFLLLSSCYHNKSMLIMLMLMLINPIVVFPRHIQKF